jgi:RHS repeat-associated protein
MYQPASSGIYYYHTDPAGTPLAVTNTSGAVVWKGYYEPFGNEYAIQGTIGNDVRFAGNKKDDETGLNYFGARYMDSALGRFRAPDPVGPVDSKTGKINDKILTEPQRLNAYAYALNGPGRYVDRSGKQAELLMGAGQGTAQAIAAGSSGQAARNTQSGLSREQSYQMQQDLSNAANFINPLPVLEWMFDNVSVPIDIEHDILTPSEFAEHTKGKRKSTWDKHSGKRPGDSEKVDEKRRPPRQRPDDHVGPWPPKEKD